MDSNGESGRGPEPHSSKALFINPWFTRRSHVPLSTSHLRSPFVSPDEFPELRPPSPTPSCSSMASSTFYSNMPDLHEANLNFKDNDDQNLVCLLCADAVEPENERIITSTKFRMVRNLCYQLRLSTKGFPKNPEYYPFCNVCEGMLKKISECQQIISVTTAEIERKVADTEILKGGLVKASQEPEQSRGFFRLREMILEGYRAKLVIGRIEREREKKRILLGNPLYSNISTESAQDSQDQRNSTEAEDDDEEEENTSQTQNITENLNVDTNSMDSTSGNQESAGGEEGTDAPVAGPSGLNTSIANKDTGESQHEEMHVETPICKLEVFEPEGDFEEEVEPPIVGVYNERNCTLTVECPKATKKTPQQLKEERIRLQAAPPKVVQRKETDAAMPVLSAPGLGPTSSSLIFQGVRIYRIGGLTPDQRYLRCSRCRFTVDSTNFREEGTLPIQTMKHHILTEHLNTRATPLRTFKDAVFKEPLPVGPPRYRFNPPPRPTSSIKLTVVRKGKSFTSRTTFCAKKRRTKPKKRTYRPRKYTLPVDAVTGEAIVYACHLCDRTFTRNCHRVRHMTAHTNKELREQAQNPPVLTPQPKCIPVPPPQWRTPPEVGNDTSGRQEPERNNTASVDELCRAVGIHG